MTRRRRTRSALFEADALVDVDDRSNSGYVCPTPARTVGSRVRVWPRPKVRTDVQGRPVSVELDLTAWCVTFDAGEHPAGITLPLLARGQQAAEAAAQAFAEHVAEGNADPLDPAYLVEWSRWWCGRTDDARLSETRKTR